MYALIQASKIRLSGRVIDTLSSLYSKTDFSKVWRHAIPDSKVHGAHLGPTWVLSAPDGPIMAPWTLLSGMFTNLIKFAQSKVVFAAVYPYVNICRIWVTKPIPPPPPPPPVPLCFYLSPLWKQQQLPIENHVHKYHFTNEFLLCIDAILIGILFVQMIVHLFSDPNLQRQHEPLLL